MKRKNIPALLSVVVVAAASAACQDIESTDVLTSGVGPDFSVTLDGSGDALVRGSLHAGSATSLVYLELVDDDRLVATLGEEEKQLEKIAGPDFNAPAYGTSYEAAKAEGNEVSIAFVRTVDEGAPASKVTVPLGYAIAEPAAAAEVSRHAELVVRLDRALVEGEIARVTVDGDCIDPASAEAESGDTLTLAAESIKKSEQADGQPEVADSCTADVSVQIERTGTIDAAYGEAGSITARQVRSLQITSTP